MDRCGEEALVVEGPWDFPPQTPISSPIPTSAAPSLLWFGFGDRLIVRLLSTHPNPPAVHPARHRCNQSPVTFRLSAHLRSVLPSEGPVQVVLSDGAVALDAPTIALTHKPGLPSQSMPAVEATSATGPTTSPGPLSRKTLVWTEAEMPVQGIGSDPKLAA